MVYICIGGSIINEFAMLKLVREETNDSLSNEPKLGSIIESMVDNGHCSLCVDNYGGSMRLKQMVAKHNRSIKKNSNFESMKKSLNLLCIVNNIVVFVVYGGPILITTISVGSSVLSFSALFLRSENFAFYLECSIMCVSFIVWVKTVYIVTLQVFVNQRRIQNKKTL